MCVGAGVAQQPSTTEEGATCSKDKLNLLAELGWPAVGPAQALHTFPYPT